MLETELESRLLADGARWREAQAPGSMGAAERMSVFRRSSPVAVAVLIGLLIIGGATLRGLVSNGPSRQEQSAAPSSQSSESSSNSEQGFVVGSGANQLSVTPPRSEEVPPISEQAARSAVARFVASPTGDSGSRVLLSFTFGNATVAVTQWGSIKDLPVWVAHYRVPFADIPPVNCPRVRATPLSSPRYGDVVILVRGAGPNDIAMWNTLRNERCA
jgi:hypothetical protein